MTRFHGFFVYPHHLKVKGTVFQSHAVQRNDVEPMPKKGTVAAAHVQQTLAN